MAEKRIDSLDIELANYEKEDIVEAQQLLMQLLKTSKIGYTTFDKVLFGLIDTYAAQSDTANNPVEKTNKAYQRIMSFCADRLTLLNKPRATNKLLKEITEQYTSRDQWRKDAIQNRIKNCVSVGTHQFSSYKPEFEMGYSEQYQKTEETLKYYNSQLIGQKQKKLTSYANGLTNELINDRLVNLLGHADVETVKRAVDIINNVKETVIHAKEVKKRKENALVQTEKTIKFTCEHTVNKVADLTSLSLTELINLVIHYTNAPSRLRSGQDYRIDPEYFFQNIESCNTNNIVRFRADLIYSMNDALSYLLRRVAWKYEINGEYTALCSPLEALTNYINNWRENHFSNIEEKHKQRFLHVEKVISEHKEIEENNAI